MCYAIIPHEKYLICHRISNTKPYRAALSPPHGQPQQLFSGTSVNTTLAHDAGEAGQFGVADPVH